MNIAVIGKGNVGSGLAKLWRRAGHSVTEIGREGGVAADADVLLVAVPSGAIADAVARVSGLEGNVAIDATNAHAGRDERFESPVSVGDLERARALEDCGMELFRAIRLAGLGPTFQRFARPGEL